MDWLKRMFGGEDEEQQENPLPKNVRPIEDAERMVQENPSLAAMFEQTYGRKPRLTNLMPVEQAEQMVRLDPKPKLVEQFRATYGRDPHLDNTPRAPEAPAAVEQQPAPEEEPGITEKLGALKETIPASFKASIAGLGEASLDMQPEDYLPPQLQLLSRGYRQAKAQLTGKAPDEPLRYGDVFDFLAPGAADEMRARSHELTQAAEQTIQQANEDLSIDSGEPMYYVNGVLQAVAEMTPSVAATVVTRNPRLGAALMGSQVFGREYSGAIESGRTQDEAFRDALFYAGIETITEKIPLDFITRYGKKAFSGVLAAGAAEGVQEAVTEALSIGYEAGVLDEDVFTDPETGEFSLIPALKRLRDAGIIGAGSGALMRGGVETVRGTAKGVADSLERRAERQKTAQTEQILRNFSESDLQTIPEYQRALAQGMEPPQALRYLAKLPQIQEVATAGAETLLAEAAETGPVDMDSVIDRIASAEPVTQAEASVAVKQGYAKWYGDNIVLLPAGKRMRAQRMEEQAAAMPEAVQAPVDAGGAPEAISPMQQPMQQPVQTGAIDAAAAEAATSPENDLPEPTDAQKEAGNYRKGHLTLHGLDVSIENPAGTSRRPEWPPLTNHYGYIRRTEAADGEQLDAFLGPQAEDPSKPVFVVDQIAPETGAFDEQKALLGWDTPEQAADGYRANYSPDWQGLGGLVQFDTLEQFKDWTRNADGSRPAAETAPAFGARVVEAPTVEPEKINTTEPPLKLGGKITPEAMSAFEALRGAGKTNPMNEREIVLDDEAAVDVRPTSDGLLLQSIRSFGKGKGAGARALDRVLKAADEAGVAVTLQPQATEADGLTTEQLVEFYRKRGFEGDATRMTREPGVDTSASESINSEKIDTSNSFNRPLAAEGLDSYRYRGRYGWIMIGAKDDADALNEAKRSTDSPITAGNLQRWDGERYVDVQPAGEQTFAERRRNTADRARVAALPKDERDAEIARLRARTAELEKKAFTEPMTGLKNRAAWEERDPKPAVAIADVDGLKWVNDNLGYESGDKLLKAIGEALGAQSGLAYRIGGDEFALEADTPEELQRLMDAATDALGGAEIDFVTPDGKTVTYAGLDISYGIGGDPNEAESRLKESRKEREASGEYRRGAKPRGIREDAAARQQDQVDPAEEVSQIPLFSRAPRTESAAFKKWFGDSKVVDANGEPLVVYHGTGKVFDAFDPEADPVNYESDRGKFFFTTSREAAQGYAEDDGTGRPVKTPRVIEAFVSLQKPFVVDNADNPTAEWDSDGDLYERLAKNGGHDGIIIQTEDGSEKLVVAFRPEQIKSATGNRGTFDPKNPNILFSRGGDWSPENYPRVMPRDLFNEAKTLSMHLKLIDDYNAGKLPSGFSIEIEDESLTVALSEDGQLFLPGVKVYFDGEETSVEVTYNAGKDNKFPIHITAEQADAWSVPIYDDSGKLDEDFTEAFGDQLGAPATKVSAPAAWTTANEFYKQLGVVGLWEVDRLLPAGFEFDLRIPERGFQLDIGRREIVAKNLVSRLGGEKVKFFMRPGENKLRFRSGDSEGVVIEGGRGMSDAFRDFVKNASDENSDVLFQRVFHGTPHRFDKFSLEAIGTGEGAQAYGWGLYFAGKREVAEYYRETTSIMRLTGVDGKKYGAPQADAEETARALLYTYKTDKKTFDAYNDGETYMGKIARDIANGTIKEAKGNVYQVEIPEDSELLDWDAPLIEQPEEVLKKLAKIGITAPPEPSPIKDVKIRAIVNAALKQDQAENVELMVDNDRRLSDMALEHARKAGKDIDELLEESGAGEYVTSLAREHLDALIARNNYTGERAYRDLVESKGSDKAASLALNAAGIPGLRYLDASSRDEGEGTHNYVIWDEDAVTVEAVNDELRQAKALLRRGTPATDPPQTQRTRRLINTIATEFAGRPYVQTVNSWRDLPDSVQQFISDAHEGAATKGVYVGGTQPHIYLVAENLQDERDATETLIHEMIGHYGVRSVLGEAELFEMADQIAAAQPGKIREAIARNGLDKMGLAPDVMKRIAAEEVIAYAAQDIIAGKTTLANLHAKVRFWVERVMAAIRRMLGLADPKFAKEATDAEIIRLIARAYDFVRTGRAARTARMGYALRSVNVPPFYSQLVKTINDKLPERAPPAEYLKQIQGQLGKDGLKPEEFKWSGLEDALSDMRVHHLNKTDWPLEVKEAWEALPEKVRNELSLKPSLLDADARVSGMSYNQFAEKWLPKSFVNETKKEGTEPAIKQWFDLISAPVHKLSKAQLVDLVDRNLPRIVPKTPLQLTRAGQNALQSEEMFDDDELQREMEEQQARDGDFFYADAGIEDMDEPNRWELKNYIVVRKTERNEDAEEDEDEIEYEVIRKSDNEVFETQGADNVNDLIQNLANYRQKLLDGIENDPEKRTNWLEYMTPGGDPSTYEEYLYVWENNPGERFTYSSHWNDAANVLLHVRSDYNRETPDGAKLHYIDELQSDWHQEARERGFIATEEDKKRAEEKLREETKKFYAEHQKRFPKLTATAKALKAEYDRVREALVAGAYGETPRARAGSGIAVALLARDALAMFNLDATPAERAAAFDRYADYMKKLRQIDPGRESAVQGILERAVDSRAAETALDVLHASVNSYLQSKQDQTFSEWVNDQSEYTNSEAVRKYIDGKASSFTKEHADALWVAHAQKNDGFTNLTTRMTAQGKHGPLFGPLTDGHTSPFDLTAYTLTPEEKAQQIIESGGRNRAPDVRTGGHFVDLSSLKKTLEVIVDNGKRVGVLPDDYKIEADLAVLDEEVQPDGVDFDSQYHLDLAEAIDDYAQAQSGGIPFAPMAQSYQLVALKHQLQLAVQEGMDEIAIATGERHALRWGGLEQRTAVRVLVSDDGERVSINGGKPFPVSRIPFAVSGKHGAAIAERVKSGETDFLYGKQAATTGDTAKVMFGKPYNELTSQEQDAVIQILRNTESLTKDAEPFYAASNEMSRGLLEAYNSVQPKMFNKFLKRYGMKFELGEMLADDDDPISSHAVVGDEHFRVAISHDNGQTLYHNFLTKEAAENFATSYGNLAKIEKRSGGMEESVVPVWRAKITPAAREAATKHGFPLFQKRDDSEREIERRLSAMERGERESPDMTREEAEKELARWHKGMRDHAFKKWFGDSKVVDENGEPLVVYHGTEYDFDAFDLNRIGNNWPGSVGFYFTNDPAEAELYTEDDGSVMPVYLSIKNPLRRKSGDQTPFDYVDEHFDSLKEEAAGRDGMIVEDDHGLALYIAFRPEQIKSAVGNRGTFDRRSPNILFAKADKKTTDIVAGFRAKRQGAVEKTLPELVKEWTQDWKARLNQYFFDDFYGLKRAEVDVAQLPKAQWSYVSARLARGVDDVLRTTLEYGAPVWDSTDVATRAPTYDRASKPFFEILAPLRDAELLEMWKDYVVAYRARRLKAEDRENLFTSEEIETILKLSEEYPLLEQIRVEYAALNKKILDFAQAAGVINPETRALWENQDYVPFYRVIDDAGRGKVNGPFTGTGRLANLGKVIKTLRGGRNNMGDPVDNIIMNWSALLRAALNNHAELLALDNLTGTGLVTKARQVDFKKALASREEVARRLKAEGAKLDDASLDGFMELFVMTPPAGENILNVFRNGKREYWEIHDSLLFRAMTAIGKAPFGPWMNIFRIPKRVLTQLITLEPVFQFRNWFRDAWSSFVLRRDGKAKPMLDGARGFVKTLRKSEDFRDMMAGGATFESGYVTSHDPGAVQKVMRARMRNANFRNSIIDKPMKLFEMWRDVTSSAENANRVPIYERVLKDTGSRKLALYESKDIMDFSMRGEGAVIRFLTESTAFFNARLQGLYRIPRTWSELPNNKEKAKFAARLTGGLFTAVLARGVTMITIPTLILYLRNRQLKCYTDLPDYDKDMYFHFFVGDASQGCENMRHYRLPKPFEVGALFATVPERMLEAALSEEPDAGKQLADRLQWILGEMLNLNPTPTTLEPFVEIALNRDSFRDAPILNMHDQKLLPEMQYDYRTPPTYRFLSQYAAKIPGAPDWLKSPKQLEHIVSSYIGTLGNDYAILATDAIVRSMQDYPPPPAKRLDEIPGIKSLVREHPLKYTEHMDAMYGIYEEVSKYAETAKEIEDQIALMDAAGNESMSARLQAQLDWLEQTREPELIAAGELKAAIKQIGGINEEIMMITLDAEMSPEEKRKEIDALYEQRNEIAEEAIQFRPGGPENPREEEEDEKEEPEAVIDRISGMTRKQQVDALNAAGLPQTAMLVDSLPTRLPRRLQEELEKAKGA